MKKDINIFNKHRGVGSDTEPEGQTLESSRTQ